MGGGDFSTEAYQQLRDAYANEQQRQVDDEIKGTHLMGQDYGLETVPVDSPWADKIELWEYPDGKQPREDEKQSPDEILQIMRDSAQERIDSKKEEVEEEAEEEIEVEAESDAEDEAEEENEAEDDINIAEMSDEEFDAYLNSILAQRDGDEDEETEEEDSEVEEVEESDEPEADEEEGEEEPEEEAVEEPAVDLDDVASQIAELRAELESMQFVSETEEEPEADDESE